MVVSGKTYFKTMRKKSSRADDASLFQNMVDASVHLAVCFDKKKRAVDFIVLEANKAWEKMTGISRKDAIGKRSSRIFPIMPRQWFTMADRVLKTRKGRVFEYYARTTDRWFKASFFSPKPGECVLTFADITENKRIEEQIRSSEETFRSLLNAISETAVLIDTEGKILAINETGAKWFGMKPGQMLGKNAFNLTPHSVWESRTQKKNMVIASGKPVVFEDDRNGQFWRSCMYPVFDQSGRVARIAAVAFNITETKLVQDRLKENEERFRTLIEGSSDMIQVVDEQGVLEYVSPSMQRIMGYDPQEPLGDSAFKIVHPDDRAEVLRSFKEVLTHPQMPVKVVCRCRHKDGSWHYLETWAKNNMGNAAIRGIVLNIRDVSEREEQNQMLQQKNIALREVMTQLEAEKKRVGEQIRTNVERLVLPLVDKIQTRCSADDRKYLRVLEENLQEITSGFPAGISSAMNRLTQKEIEICNMIKRGLSSKEIGRLMNISFRTVETHRNRIRRKLGITDPTINLPTFLKTL